MKYEMDYASEQLVMTTQDYFSRVVTTFEALLEAKAEADIAFICRQKDFPGHRLSLTKHEEVCEELFLAAMNEGQDTKRSTMPNPRSAVFNIFLQDLYSAESTNADEIVGDLILLAYLNNVKILKIICKDYMLATFSEQNAIQFFIIADRIHCSELRRTGLELFRSIPSTFEKKFGELSVESEYALKRAFNISNEYSDFNIAAIFRTSVEL